jgi:hypothetical protein
MITLVSLLRRCIDTNPNDSRYDTRLCHKVECNGCHTMLWKQGRESDFVDVKCLDYCYECYLNYVDYKNDYQGAPSPSKVDCTEDGEKPSTADRTKVIKGVGRSTDS